VQSTCLLLQSGTRECSLVRRNRLDDLANQWRPDILFNPAAPCSDHCKHFTVERAEPRLGLCYSLVAGSRRPDQHVARLPRMENETDAAAMLAPWTRSMPSRQRKTTKSKCNSL